MRGKFLLAVVIFTVFASCAQAAYYDGAQSGDSADDAYLISSVDDLKLLRDRVNSGTEERGKYYLLTSDLDLRAEKNWQPIGLQKEDISLDNISIGGLNNFYGHFDGGNHTIRVAINREGTKNVYAALFGFCGAGQTHDASIKNLKVSGTVIARAYAPSSNGSIGDAAVAGGIAVRMSEGSSIIGIENCEFNGIVSAYHDYEYGIARAGGILGYVQSGVVKNCSVPYGSFVIADAPNSSAQYSASYAGGIYGYNDTGDIEKCTARARIFNAQCQGGIAGEDSIAGLITKVTDCIYSGAEWGIGETNNGYVDSDVSVTPSDNGCTFTPIKIDIFTGTLPPTALENNYLDNYTLTDAVMGRSYSVQLIASEVRAIDKWEVTSGELPDGMSLTKTGLLSGTPKAAGDYEFDITVSMSGFDLSDTVSYKLTVQESGSSGGHKSSGGGSGGCDAGFGLLSLALLASALLKRKI